MHGTTTTTMMNDGGVMTVEMTLATTSTYNARVKAR